MGQKDKTTKPEAQDAAPAVPAAVPAVPPAAAPAAPTIDFSAPVNAGTTFKITGSKGTVSASVYLLPAGAVGCSLAQTLDPKATELSLVPDTAKPETTAPQVSVDPSTGPSITLAAPVSAGTALCLAAYSVSDPETPIYSQLAPVSAAAPAPSIGFGGTLLTDGDTIAVAGTSGHNITVYVFAPKYTPLSKSKDANGASLCIQADVQSGPQKLAFKNAGAGAPLTSAALTSALTALQLENPLTSGSSLCIADTTAAKLSSFGVVQDPKAATVVAAAAPEFAGTPSTGSTSIVVSGTLGDVISVYQLDSTASGDCGTLLKTSSPVLVQINTGTAATPALSNSTTLSGTPPFTVNLANPPASSTQLCLKQTDAKGASPQYSALMKVSDANNPYPFVRTFYTAGAMINNQNGANGSSSGAEYLDLGLTFTLPPGIALRPQARPQYVHLGPLQRHSRRGSLEQHTRRQQRHSRQQSRHAQYSLLPGKRPSAGLSFLPVPNLENARQHRRILHRAAAQGRLRYPAQSFCHGIDRRVRFGDRQHRHLCPGLLGILQRSAHGLPAVPFRQRCDAPHRHAGRYHHRQVQQPAELGLRHAKYDRNVRSNQYVVLQDRRGG